jgi:hypothetical protein
MLFNRTNLNEIFSKHFPLIDSDDRNIFIYRKNELDFSLIHD